MKLRVYYAKRKYKDKTYITPLVVYSYRNKKNQPRNKTILNISKLPQSIIKMIEQALKLGDVSVLKKFVNIETVHYSKSLVVGPVYVVLYMLRSLGIISLLKRYLSLTLSQSFIIIALIMERVISAKPRSIMAQQRRFLPEPAAKILNIQKSTSLKNWYKAIAALESNREDILSRLYEKTASHGKLFFYDITSSYFEGSCCPIAKFGYNRDGKKGKLQIVIGVICDDEGGPIWVEVFEGNTSDQMTVAAQVNTLRQRLGIKELIFVGERGMLTSARLDEFEKQSDWWEEFQYITAIKRSEMMLLIEDATFPIQIELFDHKELGEIEYDGIRYVLCHNPMKETQDRETRERLLQLSEEKMRMIKGNVEKGRFKKQDVINKKVYSWLNRWGMGKFFKIDKVREGVFEYSKQDDQIERYSRLDGCYIIKSNIQDKSFKKNQLLKKYKDLINVQQAFRTMKSADILVRPIRHWEPEHVKGHVLICFLAYRLIGEMRQKLSVLLHRDKKTRLCELGSFQEVWGILSRITLGKTYVGDQTLYQISEIDDQGREVLNYLEIPDFGNIEETVSNNF